MAPFPVETSPPEQQVVPLVLSVPHAGRLLSPQTQARLVVEPSVVSRTEDLFVDQLAEHANEGFGARLVKTQLSRIEVDVNRARDERDGELEECGRLTYREMSFKARHGYGVVPRRAVGAIDLYKGRLSAVEIERRLLLGWDSYHQALDAAIEQTLRRFGHCTVVDCHSMPPLTTYPQAQVVLGDNYGRSIPPAVRDRVIAALRSGPGAPPLSVNEPYAGGYITQAYGAASGPVYALQVELCRSLYLDDDALELLPGWSATAAVLRRVFEGLL